MPVGVAAAICVHQPSHQYGKQDEGDKPAKQRPEHAGTIRASPRVPLAEASGRRRHTLRSRLGVQRALLARRGKRPRHLHPALLAKDETHLTGRAKAVRVIRAVRRARTGS